MSLASGSTFGWCGCLHKQFAIEVQSAGINDVAWFLDRSAAFTGQQLLVYAGGMVKYQAVAGNSFAGQEAHDDADRYLGERYELFRRADQHAHLLGQQLLQSVEGRDGAKLSRRLKPTAQRDEQKDHAADLEVNLAFLSKDGIRRVGVGRCHAEE